MDPLMEVADKHGIPVVEDAACAIGTTYNDRYCGSIGAMGCFSFHPRKVITTGEGGMIVTNDEELANSIRVLRSHGGVKAGKWYEYQAAGFNYRLSDVHGAIGVAQMKKLSTLIERKRTLANELMDRLSSIQGIQLPSDPPWGGHIYQSFVILVDENIDRDQIILEMGKRDIETTLGTYAVHDQPYYQSNFGYKTGQLANSHLAFTKSITLPLYPQMDESDLDLIAVSLQEIISKLDYR
jgi:dTDP-4-amino-4,6-dideoxygalactose transaminase